MKDVDEIEAALIKVYSATLTGEELAETVTAIRHCVAAGDTGALCQMAAEAADIYSSELVERRGLAPLAAELCRAKGLAARLAAADEYDDFWDEGIATIDLDNAIRKRLEGWQGDPETFVSALKSWAETAKAYFEEGRS